MRFMLGTTTVFLAAAVTTACSTEPDPTAPRTESPSLAVSAVAGQNIYAVTTSDRLVSFSSADACTITSEVKVTGLGADESLLGIDFRPATGELYGLGSSSRLYTINTTTGAATAIGAAPFTPTLSGSSFVLDFNPTVDRVRVVSNAGQNLRLHPTTGAVVLVDGSLAYNTGDVNFGRAPTITAAAYTNPDNNPATGTTLYDIDGDLGVLVTQNPPNDGKLNTVGPLGVKFNDLTGFDISPSGVGYAVLKVTGKDQPKHTCGNSELYSINLQTGAATRIGSVGTSAPLRGIATPAP